MAAPVFDGRFVTFGGTLDRLLGRESGPVQDLRDGGDAEGDVEHPADQGADPGQRPALILVPAGRGRALVELHDQFLHEWFGQHRVGAGCAFRGQGLIAARGPGTPPCVCRLGRNLQRGRDLRTAHPVAEHPRRLLAYLLAADASLRTDTTTVAVSHVLPTDAWQRSEITQTGDVDIRVTLTREDQ